MPGPHDQLHNYLLAGLSLEERDRLFPHLRLVELPLGKVLYEPGDVLLRVYFPVDCVVSLLYVLENGESAEISVGDLGRWQRGAHRHCPLHGR
jgi:hypothetical protein